MEYDDNERKFMEILDLCNELDVNTLKNIIANIEIIIDNKIEEESESEDYE